MFKSLKRSAKGAAVPHTKATAGQPTNKMPVPEHVVIPMSMHIGAPAEPVVKKGDTVMVGTVIGKAGGFVSANIYSSVSGTVQDIAPLRMVNGAMTTAVAIKTDGAQTVDPACVPPVVTDKASLLAAVQTCGLVGVGGAGFPTHVKLAANTIDTLLINAAECEPYLTTDCREMLECSDTIISGITAVMKYCEIPHCIIGIERNKPECIDLLTSLTREMKGVEVKGLPMRYPQGAEKTLIKRVMGRIVPSGGLPADVGVVVDNISTVKAISDAIQTGMPLVERVATVTGEKIKNPGNFIIKIGTSVKELIDYCGGFTDDDVLVKMGGPMMGFPLNTLDVPMMKGSNGIIAVEPDETKEQPCIKCGRCVDVCPMELSPLYFVKYAKDENWQGMKDMNVMDCVECRCCQYICSSKIPIINSIKAGKNAVRGMK